MESMLNSSIIQVLLRDYSNVYCVDAKSKSYKGYSFNTAAGEFGLIAEGDDFFSDLIRDAKKRIYIDDQHIFVEDLQKDKLIKNLGKGTLDNVIYRLMINGEPVWHTVKIYRVTTDSHDYFVIGVLNVQNEVSERIKIDQLERERNVFTEIASQLAERYNTIFYVDRETDYFREFSSIDLYNVMNVPESGNNFFDESISNAMRLVHEDDRKAVIEVFTKNKIVARLERERVVHLDYRLDTGEETIYLRMSVMFTKDKKHMMYCVEDRQEYYETEAALQEERDKRVIYGQIAESLACHYDTIYYVDVQTDFYTEFAPSDIYKTLKIPEAGRDFFEESRRNAERVVFHEDRDLVINLMRKEHILNELKNKRLFNVTYRLVIEDEPKYTKLSIIWANDRKHLVVGVEDVDEQVRKLDTAKKKALRDDLTGVKNKNAYGEYTEVMQENIDYGEQEPFAIVVCDLNNLKSVNDSFGHIAGDEYIRESCSLICSIFAHSPVFRIGGDEFAVVLTKNDYADRHNLFDSLRSAVLKNKKDGGRIIIASGIAEFEPSKHENIADVFKRADNEMYENKRLLKRKGS